MTEEEGTADPKALAGPQSFGEALFYDFAKFMTTLSLLILGAVLTLSQDNTRGEIKPFNMLLMIGAISIAGVLSLTVAGNLAQTRSTGQPPSKHLNKMMSVALALLGIGTGAFLQIWWTTMR